MEADEKTLSPFWDAVTPEWVLPYAGYAMIFNNLSAYATYSSDPNSYTLDTGGQKVSMAIVGVQAGRQIYANTNIGVNVDAVANLGVIPNTNWSTVSEYTIADGTPITAEKSSSTTPQILLSLGFQGSYSGVTVAVLGGATYENITAKYDFTNTTTDAHLYSTESSVDKWKPVVEADFGYKYHRLYAGMSYYGASAVPGINTANNTNFHAATTQITQSDQAIWDARVGYLF